MPIIKTLKHEMSYDTETKRAIFNSRNKTGSMPTQDAFPKRLLSISQGLKFDVSKLDTNEILIDNFEKGYILNQVIIRDKKTNNLLGESHFIGFNQEGEAAGIIYSNYTVLSAFTFASADNDDITVNMSVDPQLEEFSIDDLDIECTFIKLEGSFSYEL